MFVFRKTWMALLLLLWCLTSVSIALSRPLSSKEDIEKEGREFHKNVDDMEDFDDDTDFILKGMKDKFLKHVSAVPPFLFAKSIESEGIADFQPLQKIFKSDQHTMITNSFLRILQDHSSNSEYFERTVFISEEPIGTNGDEFSVFLKFRLSGKDVQQSGVIFALTFTTGKFLSISESREDELDHEKANNDAGYAVFGNNWMKQEGSEENPFQGFAVVIDTSKKRHKKLNDISIIYNNGLGSPESVYKAAVGCKSNFHFWSDRDDVHMLTASQLRFTYISSRIVLEIDAYNTGEWEKCCSVHASSLPKGFTKKAHVGMVGVERGGNQGTSNLDILGLQVYSVGTVPDFADIHESRQGHTDVFDRLLLRVEHETMEMFTLFRRSIVTASEVAERNDKLMTDLETSFKGDRLKEMSARLTVIEKKLKKDVHHKLDSHVKVFEDTLMNRIDSTLHEMHNNSKYWVIPLIGIIVLAAGMYIFSFMKYRELKKAHLC